jgi:hypothetical protein
MHRQRVGARQPAFEIQKSWSKLLYEALGEQQSQVWGLSLYWDFRLG